MSQVQSLFQGEAYPHPLAKNKRILIVGTGQAARWTAAAVAAVGAEPVIADPAGSAGPDDFRVVRGELRRLIGLAGAFKAQIKLTGRTKDCLASLNCGGVVLAADPVAGEMTGLPQAMKPLSDLAIDDLAAHAKGGLAVILSGYWDHGLPAGFRRALEAGLKLSGAGLKVMLFCPQAKVAGPGLEELYRRARREGVVITRLAQPPEFSSRGGKLKMNFFDPILPGPVEATVQGLLADPPGEVEGIITRAAGAMELAFGPDGWPTPDNLLYPPPLTSRAGVWAVGGARGADGLDLGEDLALLGMELADYLAPDEGSSAVRVAADRSECATCLTCFRACPVRAIGWDMGPIVLQSVCLECGQCASVCPASIIEPTWDLEQDLRGLLKQPGQGDLLLACGRIPAEVLDRLPASVTCLSLSCAGRVSEEVLLRLASNGWTKIVVAACHHDNCRSLTGSRRAEAMVGLARDMLARLGLPEAMIQYAAVAPNQPNRLAGLFPGGD